MYVFGMALFLQLLKQENFLVAAQMELANADAFFSRHQGGEYGSITKKNDLEEAILLVACLIGLIPESGPHLLFLTLFVENIIPFSTFLASSIVQDGHGMLPLLAKSRRDFLKVKAINLLVGFLTGFIGYASRW